MPTRTSTQSRGMLRWGATPVLLISAAAGLGVTGPAPHAAAGTTAARSFTAYVVNSGSDTVTPINTATGAPGRPIPVGEGPLAIAMTPNGKTAYVVNSLSDTVTPITTATNIPGRPIPVGGDPADNDPSAIAITPNGKTAYVVNTLGHTVTPITVATNTAGPAIPAGLDRPSSRSRLTARPPTSSTWTR